MGPSLDGASSVFILIGRDKKKSPQLGPDGLSFLLPKTENGDEFGSRHRGGLSDHEEILEELRPSNLSKARH